MLDASRESGADQIWVELLGWGPGRGSSSLTLCLLSMSVKFFVMSTSKFQSVQEQLKAYRRAKADNHSEEISKRESSSSDIETATNLNSDSDRSGSAKENTTKHVKTEVKTGSSLSTNTLNDSESSSWWLFALKALLWVLLFGFFVQIEFGMVFLVSSGLYLMYASMRGSRRKPSEMSAYSVFNKNFEKIDGTLSAEQFEREIRYGPTSVR